MRGTLSNNMLSLLRVPEEVIVLDLLLVNNVWLCNG